MTSTTTTISDYEQIIEVLNLYVKGARSGKGKDMEPAFHKDATVFGYVGDDLFAGPIKQLFDWNENNGAASNLNHKITSIDLIGSVATVRLELDNWTGQRFTDLFTLLRIDHQWKIMNKVFHLHS